MLSIIVLCAIVSTCLGGKTVEDFPVCCEGGQATIKMMSDYVNGDFKQTMRLEDDTNAFCERVEKDASSMREKLSSKGDKCHANQNTGDKLIEQIAKKLAKVDDDCMANVGFIRALFDLAGESTAHLPKERWAEVNQQFYDAIIKIDQLPMNGIDHIQFEAKSLGGAHGRTHPKHIGITA